jgi:hypothetical protein
VRPSDPQRVDSRLAAVIEHYESHPKAGEELEETTHKEANIDSLAERLTRIPQIMDPDIFGICVHVGLSLDVTQIFY